MMLTMYNKINDSLHVLYEISAEISMHKAAEETRSLLKSNLNADEIVDCDVTVDGAWSKRGHASINGLVTAILCQRKMP